MNGFAHGLTEAAIIVKNNEAVDARSIITERIHQLRTEIQKSEGGNFYLHQEMTALQSALNGMYQLINA